MKKPITMPGAEPFFYSGGEVGCLLVHGFTASPQEMHGLGKHLANEGMTVLGVRLAGHGTQVSDMVRTHWQDWLADVEDGYHLLRGVSRRIYLVGLSMGGLLALVLATCLPVEGLVIMATPHHLPDDFRLRILRLIALFQPYRPKGQPQWFDLQEYPQRVAYSADPTMAYRQLGRLMEEADRCLPQISVPALLVYSRNDPSVPTSEGHQEKIFTKLGSEIKETLWVEQSGHILTEDQERHRVRMAVADFIQRMSGQVS
jgi:carboxylesterase